MPALPLSIVRRLPPKLARTKRHVWHKGAYHRPVPIPAPQMSVRGRVILERTYSNFYSTAKLGEPRDIRHTYQDDLAGLVWTPVWRPVSDLGCFRWHLARKMHKFITCVDSPDKAGYRFFSTTRINARKSDKHLNAGLNAR